MKKQITIKTDEIQNIFEDKFELHLWDKYDSAPKIWIYSSVSPSYLKNLIGKTTTFDH